MKTITIAIADDQMLFRRGMAAIINGFEGTGLLDNVASSRARTPHRGDS